MASLLGVADEWDNCKVVRDRVRTCHKLILALPSHDPENPRVDVATGEHNFDVLAPLAKRLQDPPGCVGMHALPSIQTESFGVEVW